VSIFQRRVLQVQKEIAVEIGDHFGLDLYELTESRGAGISEFDSNQLEMIFGEADSLSRILSHIAHNKLSESREAFHSSSEELEADFDDAFNRTLKEFRRLGRIDEACQRLENSKLYADPVY
jgi:hypothetical protein